MRVIDVAGPCQTDLELAPIRQLDRLRLHVRLAVNRRVFGLQRTTSRDGRAVVVSLEWSILVHHGVKLEIVLHQDFERDGAGPDNPFCLYPRYEPRELDRVSEALFMGHYDRLSGQILAHPARYPSLRNRLSSWCVILALKFEHCRQVAGHQAGYGDRLLQLNRVRCDDFRLPAVFHRLVKIAVGIPSEPDVL